jgi:hypothetical protein
VIKADITLSLRLSCWLLGLLVGSIHQKGIIPEINTKIDLDVKIGNLEKIIDNQEPLDAEIEP